MKQILPPINYTNPPNTLPQNALNQNFQTKCTQLNIPPHNQSNYLIISMLTQKLHQYQSNQLLKTYTISTSENPPSCTANSHGTPLGMHQITQKIGHNEPPGTVFKNRQTTHQKYWEYPKNEQNKRLITSRILWLKGLEPGINSGNNIAGNNIDSHQRYIYLHGTNREHLLGQPVTLGCITLSNQDIITLYNSVDCKTLVWITEE